MPPVRSSSSCTSLYEARRAVVDVQGQVVERVDAVEAGRQQHGPVHERRVSGRRRPGSRSSRMYSSTASRVSRRAPANSRKTRLANGCEFLSAVLNARWGGRARTLHSGCGRERRPRRRAFHAFARDFACNFKYFLGVVSAGAPSPRRFCDQL